MCALLKEGLQIVVAIETTRTSVLSRAASAPRPGRTMIGKRTFAKHLQLCVLTYALRTTCMRVPQETANLFHSEEESQGAL